MNYLELIQRFWDFNRKNQVGSTGISMYLYLLKIGYDNDCYDFQISDITIGNELGLARKTVKSTKEKLWDLGLIRFETKNGLPCKYSLITDYPLQIYEFENLGQEKAKRKIVSQKSEILEIPLEEVLPIQNSLENSSKIVNKDIETKILKVVNPIIDDKRIPNLEEFFEYAKTLENYEVELDAKIQLKYENWKNSGWKNNADRPITNWKSTLKSTLPYLKNALESESLSLESIPNIKRPKSQKDN